MKREHKTMAAAQAACRRLRDRDTPDSRKRAAEIEAEWREHPDYESDHAWLLRKQAGP